MRVNIRLTDTCDLSDCLSAIDALPFGDAEKKRLVSLGSPQRQRESLGALMCLCELVSSSEVPLTIARTADGKPYFKDTSAPHFSLSHSGGYSAAAVADAPIGLDVELVTERARTGETASRFFTASEIDELAKNGNSTLEFFKIWTRKEAIAKIWGKGLFYKSETSAPFVKQAVINIANRDICLSVCSEHPIDEVRIVTDQGNTLI